MSNLMFSTLDDIPFNLDPFYLDIDVEDGETPPELAPYIDGEFFIDLVKNGSKPFNKSFCSFTDARYFFRYTFDGKVLKRASVECADVYEDSDEDEDEAWSEAISAEELPDAVKQYITEFELDEILYTQE